MVAVGQGKFLPPDMEGVLGAVLRGEPGAVAGGVLGGVLGRGADDDTDNDGLALGFSRISASIIGKKFTALSPAGGV